MEDARKAFPVDGEGEVGGGGEEVELDGDAVVGEQRIPWLRLGWDPPGVRFGWEERRPAPLALPHVDPCSTLVLGGQAFLMSERPRFGVGGGGVSSGCGGRGEPRCSLCPPKVPDATLVGLVNANLHGSTITAYSLGSGCGEVGASAECRV